MSAETSVLKRQVNVVDSRHVSKPARYITAAIAVVTLGVEVWAYLAYRDSVDGQAVW